MYFLFAFENKIILKVDNEIITSYDIEIEYRYLSTLNKNIVNLDKKKFFEVSKDSLIKEKIKKIEILKNIDEIKLEEKYINQVIENIYKKIGITNLEEFKTDRNKISFQMSESDSRNQQLKLMKQKEQEKYRLDRVKKRDLDIFNNYSKVHKLLLKN